MSDHDPEQDQPAFDPSVLIDVAHEFLFDGQPDLTQAQVAERAGVSLDQANELWRYLGFSVVGDDVVAFSEADVEAIRITRRLTELGVVPPDSIPQFVRSVGRSFSRLADWQVRVLLSSMSDADEDDPPLDVISEVIPMVEEVQAYIWRRHLLAASSRIAMRTASEESSGPTTVGFVDIVGYTSRSRQMSTRDLAELVEHFEAFVTGRVVDAGGQVIKTIGDEVLFTVEDPELAAQVALALVDQGEDEDDELFPQVRVGLAHGPVLARLGDVYGPTVNIASRLTSVSRPGRILIDADLSSLLREVDDDREEPRYRLRRTRRISVKGYEHLEAWSLKRSR